MLIVKRFIDNIEAIREHPGLHVQPVTPEALYNHLSSLTWGAMLSTDTLSFGDFTNARQEANRACGWESRACGPHIEMREKEIPDEKIIENLLDVEIKMWQILDQWQRENLSSKEKV